MLEYIVLNTALAIVVLLNVYWYCAKSFIRSRGYSATWFHGHYRDFAHLREIAHTSDSQADRKRASTYLIGLSIGLGVFVFLVLPASIWAWLSISR